MKVLYDHQLFTGAAYGRVSPYFYELMRSFAHCSGITFALALLLSNNECLDEASAVDRLLGLHLRFRSFANSIQANQVASVLNRLHSISRLRTGQFDVFHPNYYHRYILPYVGKKPVVITFHDVRSSFPEVAGDAAVYFDSENDESIADTVERAVLSDSLRYELRQRGNGRLSLFSPAQTAQQTFDVYHPLI